MKRNPPPGNVRRFGSNGQNARSEFVNRFGEIVQTESWLEMSWVLDKDRKLGVEGYTSQPERLTYVDAEGKIHTHVPDFHLRQAGKSMEVHEVTVAKRLAKRDDLQECYAATREICEKRGDVYIINTEHDLPTKTEVVSLWYLLYFRPTAFHISEVTDCLFELLDAHDGIYLTEAHRRITQELKLEEADVFGGIMHILWRGQVYTDLNQLLMDQGDISPNVLLTLSEKDV